MRRGRAVGPTTAEARSGAGRRELPRAHPLQTCRLCGAPRGRRPLVLAPPSGPAPARPDQWESRGGAKAAEPPPRPRFGGLLVSRVVATPR